MSNGIAIIFWGCLLLLTYVFVGYPVIVWCLSRLNPRQWRRVEMLPSVSIIMAVRNADGLVREKIRHLLTLDYPETLIEILVVSDGSTDETDQILAEERDPRLKAERLPEHRGKAAALNQAIRKARHELLLFIDIRPHLDPGALRQLVTNFGDPTVGAVTGELRLRSGDNDAGSRAVGDLYWRYEQWIRKSESAIDSAVGVYGGFYAVRRSLATTLPDGLILDDMLQPMSVVRQGYRVVLDPTARVWDTWPKTSRGEFRRKVRTLAGNFQLIRLAPWLLRPSNRVWFQFTSHKILRLTAPIFLLFLLACSLALAGVPSYRWFALAQIAFYVLGVVGMRSRAGILRTIAGPAAAFCLLNAAASVGMWQFLVNGHQLKNIWVPSE